MSQDDATSVFVKTLSESCRDIFGENFEIENLKRLTGGASAVTWSCDYNGRPLILRQKVGVEGPAGDAEESVNLDGISLAAEAMLIEQAAEQGVKAPQLYKVFDAQSAIGEGILMSRVEGETLPQKMFKNPIYQTALEGLIEEFAVELTKIHTMSIESLSSQLEVYTPADSLNKLQQVFTECDIEKPVITTALNWLRDTCPEPAEAVVVHADFRMGNLLIDETGITAVIDWELAHIGDPVADIAHLCAPPWRFGRYEKQAGGVGAIDDLVEAYQRLSGRAIDLQRLSWWRVYASLNWCSMCYIMARMWRTGVDRELERIVIGTRVSESEIDLLLLFDEIFGFQDSYDASVFGTHAHHLDADVRPEELATAITEWISSDLIPNLSGRSEFKSRVARNAVGIIARMVESGPVFSARQHDRLSQMKLSYADFCEQISTGELGLQNKQVRDHLKLSSIERVLLDQPNYAGLRVAKEKWRAA